MPDKISPGPGLEPCHETLQVPGLAPLHLLYCGRHLPQVQSRGPPQIHRLETVGAQGRGPGQSSAFHLYVDSAAVLYEKQVNRQPVLRIRDVYPGSRIPDLGSRIPDPKTATKERVKKIVIITFFLAMNFSKLKIILFL
jgi:hypothetical protein